MPSIKMSREIQKIFLDTLGRLDSSKGVAAGDQMILAKIMRSLRSAKYKKKD